MWSRASLIGTEGKRALASYEVKTSYRRSLRFFIFSLNSNEFLHAYGLFWMNGCSISLRYAATCSCGALM